MSEDEDITTEGLADPGVQGLYDAVAAALAGHDKATAVRTAVEAVTSGVVTISVLYRDVLARILADTGAAWQTGKTAIWEEHLASSTVRTIVEIVYPGVLKAKAAQRLPVEACSSRARLRRDMTWAFAWSPTASTWPGGRRSSSGPTPPSARSPTRRDGWASTPSS